MVERHSIDGSGNNLERPELNSAGQPFGRILPPEFGPDGAPADGPNARLISNTVVGQGDPTQPDPTGHSGFMFAFGQFMDHDIDRQRTDPNGEDISVTAPNDDPILGGGGTIPVRRIALDEEGNPTNVITGWIDGSQIYGSSAEELAALRGENGRLLTSEGDNLPIINGRFAAGDVRVGENPDLAAVHTLFLREHNRVAAEIEAANPDFTSDQIFDAAREVVIAELQAITYNEFLPELIGDVLPEYEGYDPSTGQPVPAEFAVAAFRFGHSLVSESIDARDNFGSTTSSQQLRDAFGTDPEAFADVGADGLLRSLAADPARAMDARIVEDLRNFLNDGTPAIDLAVLNIQRGRDVGLGKLNDTREALGLERFEDFDDITSDPDTAEALEAVYASVNDVDLWLGGIAEDGAQGALVGETFQAVIAQHFLALRDGDRLYYENQDWSPEQLAAIEATTLADLIDRNTDTRGIQENAFEAVVRRTSDELVTAETSIVTGMDSARVVSGGAGDDVILPGARVNQVLRGGAGADIFQFPEEGHRVRIADFQVREDRLDFGPSVSSLDDVTITSINGGTRVEAAGNVVDLSRVGSLTADNFRFIPQFPFEQPVLTA